MSYDRHGCSQAPIVRYRACCIHASLAVDLQPHAPSFPGVLVAFELPIHFAYLIEAFIDGRLLEVRAEAGERVVWEQFAFRLGYMPMPEATAMLGASTFTRKAWRTCVRDTGKLKARYKLLCHASSSDPAK